MKLTRVTLARGGQVLIVQGVCHIGSTRLYQFLQAGLNQAFARGYTIFREGVTLPYDKDPITKNEEKARRFLSLLFSSYSDIANATGESCQSNMLCYPSGVITADISIGDTARALDVIDFKSDYLIRIFEEDAVILRHQAEQRLSGIEPPRLGFVSCLLSLYSRIRLEIERYWYRRAFKKCFPVIHGYRNRVVVDIVRRLLGDANGYIQYGGNHIMDLCTLFVNDGWTKVKVEKFEV